MASDFPTSLQNLDPTRGTSGQPLSNPSHITHHTLEDDTIEALQAKVGADASAVTTSHDYKLGGITGSDKAASLAGAETLTSKILGTGTKVTIGSDATGDIWYRHTDGTIKRLGIGTDAYILKVASGVPSWAAETVVVDASTTVKGVVEEATDAELAAGTAAGAVARLFANGASFNQVPAANKVPVALASGLLADGWLGLTTAGDLLYSDGSVLTRLALGTAGYILRVGATGPEWGLGVDAAAGDRLLISADTSRAETSETYTEHKEATVNRAGAYRIKFTIAPNSASFTAYGRIYKNGVAVGTERTTTATGGTEFSEDISGIAAGDLIQVYTKISTAGNTCTITNFRVYVLSHDNSTISYDA